MRCRAFFCRYLTALCSTGTYRLDAMPLHIRALPPRYVSVLCLRHTPLCLHITGHCLTMPSPCHALLSSYPTILLIASAITLYCKTKPFDSQRSQRNARLYPHNAFHAVLSPCQSSRCRCSTLRFFPLPSPYPASHHLASAERNQTMPLQCLASLYPHGTRLCRHEAFTSVISVEQRPLPDDLH